MKKIYTIIAISFCFLNIVHAENTDTTLNSKNKKNPIYLAHKKQMIEMSKQFQEQNRSKNYNPDKALTTNNEDVVNVSNGKMIKK